jgi:predicted nucleic acid-binding protein
VKYLVDTDWIIDAFGGFKTAQRVLNQLSSEGVGVSITSYGEIFEGAFSSPDPTARIALFRASLATFQLVPMTIDMMENFARIRATLRRQGQLIPDTDILIAATAVTLDLTLLTRNVRHFTRVPGLKLYRSVGVT